MDSRIIILRQELEANLKRQWSMKELAAKVNLSSNHLRTLFKTEFGCNPLAYLRRLRLAKARELLMDTFKTIKEIGIAVGIPDQSNFNRYFKKEYGLTPLEYRKKNKIP